MPPVAGVVFCRRMIESRSKHFLSAKDVFLTPAAEIFLATMAYLTLRILDIDSRLGWVAASALCYTAFLAWTIVFLAALRKFSPIEEGIYDHDSPKAYAWKLHSFLCLLNLHPFYTVGLPPAIFRPFFYRLLGARIHPSIISVSGRLLDPYLVTLDENALVGEEAILCPHFITVIRGKESLVIKKIRIERGAIIGARSWISPGVTVGQSAVVGAMSLVVSGASVPAGEIWAGVPAKKISSR